MGFFAAFRYRSSYVVEVKLPMTLAVRDEQLHDSWQRVDLLESNALVLYELAPLNA